MADELPGPSVGDAAEIIEHLGCDPWSFDSLRLVAESYHGGMAFSRFEITGSPAQIRGLREAFGQVTDPADALVIRRPH